LSLNTIDNVRKYGNQAKVLHWFSDQWLRVDEIWCWIWPWVCEPIWSPDQSEISRAEITELSNLSKTQCYLKFLVVWGETLRNARGCFNMVIFSNDRWTMISSEILGRAIEYCL
jgi:hypothetical protein